MNAERYRQRASLHTARRDGERARSVVVSRARLAVFLPAAALVIWSLSTKGTSPWGIAIAAVMFLLFGALVVRHARIEERVAWHEALRLVFEQSLARGERRWDRLPAGDAPPDVDVKTHSYAFDLDVFGRASLFQWIGPTATPKGRALLATWLLEPAPISELGRRQAAVGELAAHDDWREEFAAYGVLSEGAHREAIDAFVAFAEDPRPPIGRYGALQAIVYILTAATLALLALHLGGVIGPLWVFPLLVNIVLSFVFAVPVTHVFDRAGLGPHALSNYAALFSHATGVRFTSAPLIALRDRLCAGPYGAPKSMRRLNRILGFAELRSGAALLHFPIQALTLWDFHVVFALERWRRTAGPHVRDWIDASAELDALCALARVKYDNPSWSVPAFSSKAVYRARAIGHPLLADDRRVGNDVEIGPPGTLLLITGSNMSGKSTLLRAVGLNAILAQAGAPVCADELEMPPADLETSIRVQDSLELGLSYFMAALARLKGVVDAAERPRPAGRVLLYLLDEVLQGTNSVERAIAVRAIARHLLAAGAIGAMTTHDLSLTGEEPLASAATLAHFTESVDDSGRMYFDYRLRPGLATSRNALRLMELIGIDIKPE
jgi:hypothetical protein